MSMQNMMITQGAVLTIGLDSGVLAHSQLDMQMYSALLAILGNT
jgi:hypothetical protein